MVHAATAPKDARTSFDFVVVGGGTAGNVVAGRLAEKPNVSVLVIEGGKNNTPEIPEITTPARAFELRGSEYDWGYKTTLIDRPEYTRVEKPNTRGKVLGGSSAVNYYTWVRGSAATYNDWAEYGGNDWNWENTKAYFNKPSTYHDDDNLYPPELARIGNDNGPLHVSHAELVPELKPFRDALEKAWASKGQELSTDVYNGTQKGLFKCVNSIYKGVRSTSAAFVEGKRNVTLMSSTLSKSIIIDGGKAIGVAVIGPDGKDYSFRAKYEVIVSQGVFESPKLLLLSGIGPKAELQEKNVDPILDSKHVGKNLLDHPILPHVFRLKDGYGLDSHLLRAGPKKDSAIANYNKDHGGPYSSGLLELVAFPRIDEYLKKNKKYNEYVSTHGGKDPFGPGGQPHFEVDFVPMFADAFQWHFPIPPEGDWLTVIVDLMRPLSRNGEVKLNPNCPKADPYVNVRLFDNDLDLIALREGVRFIDDIVKNGEGMKDIVCEDYPWPMPRDSDEGMIRTILERSQTGFHPCGTCRLSKDINQGVVDPALKVHGVKGLRVIDASVFPVMPDCRIQNVVYMVAEKGADLIKSEYASLFR